jgi:hypothetical protein
MEFVSRRRNRKSPTLHPFRDIEPRSTWPGRLDGGATRPKFVPTPDWRKGDWDMNVARQTERMWSHYDGFSLYLAQEFQPKQLTLGVLGQMFGVIGMSPNGQPLDARAIEHLQHQTQEGVNLCGYWLTSMKTDHKREQIIDQATFRELFTRMDQKATFFMLGFFRAFEMAMSAENAK